MEYYLSGGLLRGSQVLIDASIWIAFGCFIAAIFRNMIGAEKTRSLFGNDSRYGLLIGWGIGMLLPVCSLGVIPVVRELYRSGVKPGTLIAFGLTAPLFNPLSILYGLSMSDPFAVLVFSAAAMLIVTGLGAFWSRVIDRGTSNESEVQSVDESMPSSGVRRSVAVLYSASTELVSWTTVYIAIGVMASTITAIAFSHGSLQGETEPDKIFAPAFMACYVTPIYSTPLLAMSQIGGMFQHGNSVGAAFSLLILGAGVNLGLLFWFGSAFGIRRVAVFLALLLTITIAIAYALDKPLYPKGVKPAGHTHAFDVYTHPFQANGKDLMKRSVGDVTEQLSKGGSYGIKFLGILAVVGIGFRLVETRFDLQTWFRKSNLTISRLEVVIPPWIIGLVSTVGLIIVSVFGTYLYYPDSESLLGDLSMINGSCVIAAKTGDWEAVEKWVPMCDDLSRRLEVGVFLRQGEVSEFKRAKAKAYREKLDEIRDNIADGQTSNIETEAMDLYRVYLQMSKAFRD